MGGSSNAHYASLVHFCMIFLTEILGVLTPQKFLIEKFLKNATILPVLQKTIFYTVPFSVPCKRVFYLLNLPKCFS